MTDGDGLGLRRGTLALLPHDPRWPAAYARLRDRLAASLPGGVAIHHIGSTAVPGLAAKPILDLGLAAPLSAHAGIVAQLGAEGWIDRGERDGRLLIRARGALRTHNLHLHATGASGLAAQLLLRDRLRADPELRAAYEAEKRRLLVSGVPRRDYAEAKSAFILAALEARPD